MGPCIPGVRRGARARAVTRDPAANGDVGDLPLPELARAAVEACLRGEDPDLPLDLSKAVAMQIAGETRKLLDHCELDWEEGCVEFHGNPAATTTASASQVRRPIYDSSVSQWRHYEAQLAELRTLLTAAGIDL